MGASRTLRNYLFVIVDQRRAGMLIEIEQAFSRAAGCAPGNHASHGDFGHGIDARKSARNWARPSAKLTGEKVQAQFTTDAALIGGAVVRIGSTIYDGSVRTQLERMRARMISE